MNLFDGIVLDRHDVKTELFNRLYSVDLYREIIESRLFKRLQDIHFLGAIDYLYTNKKKHTRFEHTLSVATLALHYATIKNLTFDDEKYLVCAALLHDIGHAPLSHSMEPAFKKLFNITHHKAGNKIISGTSPLGKELYHTLLKYKIDINDIITLLDGKSKKSYAFALDNPINIDTIDGVIRTLTYTSCAKNKNKKLALVPNIYTILEATTDISKLHILDEFWKLKNFVYSNVINNDIHMYADNFSQNYLLEKKKVEEEDFYLTEHQFKELHSGLFDDLKLLRNRKEDNDFSIQLRYIKRSYTINSNVKINSSSEYVKKYVHTKIDDVLNIRKSKKHTHQTLNLGY